MEDDDGTGDACSLESLAFVLIELHRICNAGLLKCFRGRNEEGQSMSATGSTLESCALLGKDGRTTDENTE